MFLSEHDAVRLVAHLGVPAALAELDERRGAFQPPAGGGLDGVRRTKEVVHFADMSIENFENPVVRLGGARSFRALHHAQGKRADWCDQYLSPRCSPFHRQSRLSW